MPEEKNPMHWPGDVWIFAIIVGAIGGLMNAINNLRRSRVNPYSWTEFFVEMLVSMGVGSISFMALYSVDIPMGAAYAGGCFAGHMGTRLIFLAENYVAFKLRGDKKE